DHLHLVLGLDAARPDDLIGKAIGASPLGTRMEAWIPHESNLRVGDLRNLIRTRDGEWRLRRFVGGECPLTCRLGEYRRELVEEIRVGIGQVERDAVGRV